jgi:hypothetical protein
MPLNMFEHWYHQLISVTVHQSAGKSDELSLCDVLPDRETPLASLEPDPSSILSR